MITRRAVVGLSVLVAWFSGADGFRGGERQGPGPRSVTVEEAKGLIDDPEDRYGNLPLSPSGEWLAVPRTSGDVEVWNLRTRQVKALPSPHGAGVRCSALGFSADGRLLAVGHVNGAIAVWDLEETRTVATVRHDPSLTLAHLGFPEGRRTLAGFFSWEGGKRWPEDLHDEARPISRVVLWDVATGQQTLVHRLDPSWRKQDFALGGARVVLVNEEAEVMVYDALRGAEECRFRFHGHSLLSGDGTVLVSITRPGDLIDVRTLPGCKPLRRVELAPPVLYDAALGNEIDLSPDGRVLAVTDLTKIHLIGTDSGRVLASFPCCPEDQYCDWVQFSPDGRMLITQNAKSDSQDRRVPRPLRFWKLDVVE
jgi:WD40 repeat protein